MADHISLDPGPSTALLSSQTRGKPTLVELAFTREPGSQQQRTHQWMLKVTGTEEERRGAWKGASK